MSLPIRTTVEDLRAVCNYLITKPTGATPADARAVVDKKYLDGRKLAALKFWGLIEDDGNKIKITERGRRSVKDSDSYQSEALREVIREVAPYEAVVERAIHSREEIVPAIEVAANWHEHFRSAVSDSDKILNEQVVCFFHIAQGAKLGNLFVGRRGQRTRFEFDAEEISAFFDATIEDTELEDIQTRLLPEASVEVDEQLETLELDSRQDEMDDESIEPINAVGSNRVFITHGKNLNILEQVKEIVEFGKYEPVVAMEHETTAKPVPEKVMDVMKSCWAAVIHVSADRVLYDGDGNEVAQINENVLIEIGAAMALYGGKFILLVEEGVDVPSNLQGLYQCRYKGDELNWETTRKLLKAFNEF